MAKTSKDDERTIRKLSKKGMKQSDIAEVVDKSQTTVSRVNKESSYRETIQELREENQGLKEENQGQDELLKAVESAGFSRAVIFDDNANKLKK